MYIHSGYHAGLEGEIIGKDETTEEDNVYVVELDKTNEHVTVSSDELDIMNGGYLPMWGTMWTFGDRVDEEWANGEYLGPHLQEMADCGFRIFEQEDLGIVFGIDGAGYSFIDEHFIPLYKARGLHWHKEDEESA